MIGARHRLRELACVAAQLTVAGDTELVCEVLFPLSDNPIERLRRRGVGVEHLEHVGHALGVGEAGNRGGVDSGHVDTVEVSDEWAQVGGQGLGEAWIDLAQSVITAVAVGQAGEGGVVVGDQVGRSVG